MSKVYIYTNEELFNTLGLAFHLIKENKGTEAEEKIVDFLKHYKDDLLEENIDNDVNKAYRNYDIAQVRNTLFNFLFNNVEYIQTFIKTSLKASDDIIDNIFIEPTELATSLEKTLENILENYETIGSIRNKLRLITGLKNSEIEELANSVEVNKIVYDAKEELTKVNKIDYVRILENDRTHEPKDFYTFLYNCFSNDPIIKEIVNEPLGLEYNAIKYILDRAKEERIKKYKEAYKKAPSITKEQLKKELELASLSTKITEEEEEKARLSEWTKINVSEPNTDIRNIEHIIASYTKTPLDESIAKLDELRKKQELEELTDEDLEEKRNLEEDIEHEKQIKETIINKLELSNIKIKQLQEEIIETPSYNKERLTKLKNDLKKERTTNKKLKIEKEIEVDRKNNYLQIKKDLDTGLDLVNITSTNGKLEATLESRYLNKKSDEIERLSYFLEDRFYNMHEENKGNYIMFSLNDYADATGRTNKQELREKLENAIKLKASLTFKVKTPYKNFNIEGEIKQIGSNFRVEAKEEKNGIENDTNEIQYIVYLDPFYKDAILWKGKGNYWASIPNELMKIENRLARGLGFYLYETLRKGLKGEGSYIRKFYMRTIIEKLDEKNLLPTGKTIKPIHRIKPLKEAFNQLEELGLISTNQESPNNPFNYYETELVGKRNLEERFKELQITIKFLVYDKDTYDRISTRNDKKKTTKK